MDKNECTTVRITAESSNKKALHKKIVTGLSVIVVPVYFDKLNL